jgi:hypothetical protein
MPITPEKYIRKPLVVVGVEVTVDNFMELALWVGGSIMHKDSNTQDGPIDPANQYILVRVHNPKSPRQSQAYVGDWILYSDRGYKVYTPKAFKNTFDPVNPEFTREKEEKAKRFEADQTKAVREEMLEQEAQDEPVLTRDAEKKAALVQEEVELEETDYDE